MISLLITWFKTSKIQTKIFAIIIAALLSYILYLGSGKIYYKYKFYQQAKSELKQNQQAKTEVKKQKVKTIKKGKSSAKKQKEKLLKIDQQLKKDEAKANNTTINNDDELYKYISDHQER